jgi:CRP-like cAMP-binding protein
MDCSRLDESLLEERCGAMLVVAPISTRAVADLRIFQGVGIEAVELIVLSIGTHSENRLLSTLPPADFELLRRHMRATPLASQAIIWDSGDSITKAYFPHRGAVSLVMVLSGGQMIETAIVGREGMLGGFAALSSHPASYRAIVQIEGAAWVIDMELLRELAQTHESLKAMLFGHERALMAQTQQVAACNASHALEARLCRWLLRACDACGATTLSTTQEAIAEILGVRRTSISLVAHTMQAAGMIRTRRGQIEILNVAGLRDHACECYDKTATNYERMLGTATAGTEAALVD